LRRSTVLISGAGIAGPTLAYWLEEAGFEVTLVEQAPGLRTGGYVIDFWGLGYDIAERMGLLPAINRIGYHMRELRIVDDDGARLTGFGGKVFSELTDGRYVTLGRSDLARLIFGQIEGKTEVLFANEIGGIEQGPDHVRVQLAHGGERRFDLVIGADGLHSKVRALTFGPQSKFERPLGYRVAAFETHGYRPRDEDIYVMYTQPGKMVGRFALHADRTLFLFVFAAGSDSIPTTVEGQQALLRETYGDGKWECPRILAELDRADDLYFDRVSQIRMGSWSRGRVALVGDAAFCISLVGGQGSALAMLSAYVLAGELAKAGGGHEEAFANYEAYLRAFIERKQRGAERFAAAFAPRTRFGLWFRNQVIRALAIPGLTRFGVGRDISDTLPLPDYRWPSPPETRRAPPAANAR
jgi:2-polyprenyl-6-methoxyphenol hydroxylase-like FAD-dependent oxidoreductase